MANLKRSSISVKIARSVSGISADKSQYMR